MSIFSDIKAFDSRGLLLLGAACLGLVVPGFLTLYAFDREVFIEADVIKLIILSASIAAPPFVTLFVTTFIGERVFTEMVPQTIGRFGGFKEWLVTHSFSNATIFFVALLIHVMADLSLEDLSLGLLVFLRSILGLNSIVYSCWQKEKQNPIFRIPAVRANSRFQPTSQPPRLCRSGRAAAEAGR